MKNKFSSSWLSSSQARKQRKYLAEAPLHLRHKLVSSNLSKDLRVKLKKRSLPVRKGDNVKVMRGKFSGKTGKIANVNLKRLRVTIEGLQRQKKDGTKINVFFNPSKLQILELAEDKFRLGRIKTQAKSTQINEVKHASKKK